MDANNILYQSVKQIIELARQQTYRSVNKILLQTYWQIGQIIVENEQGGGEKASYGKGTLKNLAISLTQDFGKGFDERNLNNMRAFYRSFPNWNAVRTNLSWTHYRLLSRIDIPAKKDYYLNEAISSNWNSRQLERNINSLYFERRVSNESSKTQMKLSGFIKDPYILEFAGLAGGNIPTEKTIEDALINHLQQFLMELGKGFAFVARQQHIVTDTSDFFIDLVFYNYYLKCFVLIDLKKGKLAHEHIGQMDMYVRMYEDLKKGEDDNPTIGIILCSEKDETIVKYSVLTENKQLFASKYLLYLPAEEELKHLIETDRQLLELDNLTTDKSGE